MTIIIFQALVFALAAATGSASFFTDVDITWGGGRARILDPAGNLIQLGMDRSSGSGFQSKAQYLFGRIDMDIKLVGGNSAGTVTACYLSSQGQGPTHDEIDIEFLGNATGEPYTLQTNVFSQGKGRREQQFYLWFDPRADFHTYSILWNPQRIIFYVDGTPIRVFRNSESMGVPYPKSQPMRLYSSLWDGEDWATRGGMVKTDWSAAPFVASYRNFRADVCTWSAGGSSCSVTKSKWWDQSLDASAAQKMKWVRDNYMIYDYCKVNRFAQRFHPECAMENTP